MSRKQNNEYMRVYMLDRYYKRRAAAIEALGGVCVVCGAEEDLQFDHIDPSSKKFVLGKGLATWAEARIQEELTKCQLLCQSCHTAKTLVDLGQVSAREVHGTASSYRYCRCQSCTAAHSAACRDQRRRRLAGRQAKLEE